jgi:hypothetical protein
LAELRGGELENTGFGNIALSQGYNYIRLL